MNRPDLTLATGLAPRSRLITFRLNGEPQEVAVKPNVTLLEVIREVIGLTGTKDGCRSGTCGACTVLRNGEPILACLTLAVSCEGDDILTVEGLAEGDDLSPLQQAFLDQGAVQCGFCTPGLLMSATALLAENPRPDIEAIKKALEGNLCRCTGYNSVIDAVRQAAGEDVEPVMK